MKIQITRRNGQTGVINLKGPLRIIEHPGGSLDILHDEATGTDFWFDEEGIFDGVGMSTGPCDLTGEEAKALLQGLKDMHNGNVKPLDQIREELDGKKRLN